MGEVMFYSHYRGRSVGRLIGTLEFYDGLRVADHATYGDGKVNWHGLYATYVWDGDTDVPYFTFKQDVDGRLATMQEFLRPLIDEELGRYGNIEYTIQEIGTLDAPANEDVTSLMRKYLFHFDDAMIEKYRDHFIRCGKIWHHHYKWRVDSIESIGYAKDGEYPGPPDHLLLKPAPQAEYKEVELPKRKTFNEMLTALTKKRA